MCPGNVLYYPVVFVIWHPAEKIKMSSSAERKLWRAEVEARRRKPEGDFVKTRRRVGWRTCETRTPVAVPAQL